MPNTTPINLENIRIFAIASAIGRAHLLRLVLIARKLRCRGAEVAFAYKEQDEILKHDGFQVFPVAGVVVTDFIDSDRKIYEAFTREKKTRLSDKNQSDPAKSQKSFKRKKLINSSKRKHQLLTELEVTRIDGYLPANSLENLGTSTDIFKSMDRLLRIFWTKNNIGRVTLLIR